MNNAVFWDVTLCGSCKKRRFGGTYCLHHQGDKNRPARNVSGNYQLKHVVHIVFLGSVLRLLVTKLPSSPILDTLIMEAIRSSETSVLTRAPRRNIPEEGILHSHRRENLKSYNISHVYYCKL
jgi:hypothetical protein